MSLSKRVVLQPMPMFATPVDQEALMEYVERFSGGERAAAILAMGLTWNLAAKLANEEVNMPEAADEEG